MDTSTDRIERQIFLKAPVSRVWRALSNAEEFGNWFGVALRGKAMRVGETLEGPVTNPGYEHIILRVKIERMEPERLLAWRWHPAAIDTVDAIPFERRANAFRLNSGGWEIQMKNIEKYVATS
jgi:uncharacterized protein YndB with AHSA1/START domain